MTTFQSKILLALAAMLGFSCWCSAQTVFSISGKVLDESGGALAGAYVELFADGRSAPLEVMTSDSVGAFRATSNLPVGLISVQYIGYKRAILEAPFPDSLVVRMELESAEIESVAVRGDGPTKVTSSGIKFTPTQSQRKLPNLARYLSKLPFVEAAGGGISVVGRGAARVYINNRLVDDYTELRDLTMEEVQSVEVIPNPRGDVWRGCQGSDKDKDQGQTGRAGGRSYERGAS